MNLFNNGYRFEMAFQGFATRGVWSSLVDRNRWRVCGSYRFFTRFFYVFGIESLELRVVLRRV